MMKVLLTIRLRGAEESELAYRIFHVQDRGERRAVESPPEASGVDSPDERRALVLVVEPDAMFRELSQFTLEAYGYRVATARSGDEAARLFSECGPDVRAMVCDFAVFNGDGAARFLLAPSSAGTPAILTGDPTDPAFDSDGRTRIRNVAAFLPKPYSFEALLEAVDSAIT